MANNINYSRFIAPLIGLVAGGGLGMRACDPKLQSPSEMIIYVIAGAVMGLLAGCVVWLIDAPSTYHDDPPFPVVSTMLALFAIVPGFCPFVGLLFAIPAFIINRKISGWQNILSRLGLGISVLMTIMTLAISVFDFK